MSPILFTPENIASNITLFLEPQFLWLGFGGVLFIFALMTLVLLYHWFSYSYRPIKTGMMIIIYSIGSFVLLSTIATSLTFYTQSV